MDQDILLSNQKWDQHAQAGLDWLIRSITATHHQGSSHIFARWRYPLRGWHLGYPETTGYIIETLMDYDSVFHDMELGKHAALCGKWLLTQQLPDGSFPSKLAGNQNPSFFNSAMISFGLLRLCHSENTGLYDLALEKLAVWLDSYISETKYIQNIGPSYYSRAIWGFVLLSRYLERADLEQKLHDLARKLSQNMLDNGAVMAWGFESADRAFTHTIAYTWRGFLELSALWQEDKWQSGCKVFLEMIESELKNHPFLAGDYDTKWGGRYFYRCVTGQAQIALIAFRMWDITEELKYKILGQSLMKGILHDQKKGKFDSQLRGAVPGSVPWYGPYMRGKYPNWAVKFYLDGLLRMREIEKD